MPEICIGGELGFPSFDTLWPSVKGIFTLPSFSFPPPPYNLSELHLAISLPNFGIPDLPDLLTWIKTPTFSMPILDLMSWTNEFIQNFVINLIGLFVDALEGLLGALPWPPLPCPPGHDFFSLLTPTGFTDIVADIDGCLPDLDFSDIIDSIKNGYAMAQAAITDLMAKMSNIIPSFLQMILDLFDEIPGLPALPSFPEIPSIGDIILALKNSPLGLTLAGLKAYLANFSFSVPGLPDFDFSGLLPDPFIETPIEPLGLIEGIKTFIAKMSNLLLEGFMKFWEELLELIPIPVIEIPEICFLCDVGTPGPPFPPG